jgi:hypothetical protein
MAQFYAGFNTGYTFATQPYTHQNRVITDSTISLFRIPFAYGKGLNLGINAGYIFSDHFSVELNFFTAVLTQTNSDNNWEKYFVRDYSKLHLSGLNGDARMKNASIQIAPLLVYSVSLGKFSPYIKTGVNLLYVKTSYHNNYTYRYRNPGSGYYLEYNQLKREYKGGLNAGFRGAVGTRYQVADRLFMSAEFMAVNSSYHFRESRTLEFNVDGEDRLNTLDENPVKFDKDESRVDYSHIGVILGIRYVFRGDK